MIAFPGQHLLDLSLLDGLLEIGIIDFYLFLQIDQKLFYVCQNVGKCRHALFCAFIASLLQIELLELAVDHTLLDLDKIEESGLIAALYDWLKSLSEHRSRKDEVLSQLCAISGICSGSDSVTPLFEILEGQEFLEKWHF